MLTAARSRAGRAVLGPAGVAVLLALVSACTAPRPERTSHQVTVCGTSVATGAMQPLVQKLQSASPPATTPTAPVTPSMTAVPGSPAGVHYIRTSDSCETGALVTVEPAANAELTSVFPARDGRPAAIGLLLTGPVVVRAWTGGRFQGSLSLSG